MKILEMQSARLTNWEVLERLKEYEAEHNGSDGTGRARPMPKNLQDIIRDVKTNLEHPESPLNPAEASKYSNDAIKGLVERLDEKYALLVSEYMMLFNHRPKSIVELNVLIEDVEKRFTEAEQEDILSIIRDVLGGEEKKTVEGENDEAEASNSPESSTTTSK